MAEGRGILENPLKIGGVDVIHRADVDRIAAYYSSTGEPADLETDYRSFRHENEVYADDFPGADMGAKIQAAVTALSGTGGKIIVPPGAHVCTDAGSGYAVSMVANIEIEFIEGAELTADGDFAAFWVPQSIHHNRFTNLYIIGSNNVAHTNNVGVLYEGNYKYQYYHIFNDCFFYQLYDGIRLGGSARPLRFHLNNCIFYDCKRYGIVTAGQGNYSYRYPVLLVGCLAYGVGNTGFYLLAGTRAIACHAYNCGAKGFYLTGITSAEQCHATNSVVGFHIYDGDVNISNCWAGSNSTAGFDTEDNAARNIHLILNGNRTVVGAAQAYAFKFNRGVKQLIYIGNDASGYSTAAEFWHADVIPLKPGFEIGHNYLG